MAKKSRIVVFAAITALIIIPVTFVVFVARAKWVHKPLNYYSQDYTGPDKKKVLHTVGNIVLHDQYGNRVTMNDFDSCIIVANIFFASCAEICPKMNSQVEVVAAEFQKMDKIRFLSISIDPENDSIAVLKTYADKFHANLLHWQFCTGNKAAIYDWVLNDLMLASEQRGRNFIHDDKVVIIDRDKYVRSILPSGGTTKRQDFEAYKRIKDDIENLLYEYREKDMAQ